MTCYAVDEHRNVLIQVWATGPGHRAADVASFRSGTPAPQRVGLAAALTGLSEALWRCYTHPASAEDSTDINSEGWRRQQTRDGFKDVAAAIRHPHMPDEARTLTVSYDPVQERAHQVGRVLRTLDDLELLQAVVADVEAELLAVENSERGDLAGRAAQAVVLSRADASPVQVAAADAVLRENPLRADERLMELDPTAAAVAAAHWLKAAADVTAHLSGVPADEIVVAADDIAAVPHLTATTVLTSFKYGQSPRHIIVALVAEALLVAEGVAPGTGLQRDRDGEETDQDTTGSPAVRLTTLDPRRPGPDLLEDLLAGIRACRQLYGEYASEIVTPPQFDDENDTSDGADEDAASTEYDNAVNAAFCSAVRARAAKDHARLS